MKTIKLSGILALFIMIVFTQSCKNDDDNSNPTPTSTDTTTAHFHLQFNHVWAMAESPFALNTELIHPMTGDTMKFTMLRYYVSNIQVKKTDGTWWSEANSYHIIDVSDAEQTEIEVDDVPEGTYSAIRFMFGVDSAHNVSGAQDGALSVSEGMFWSWNNGYIMMKAEGTSNQVSGGSFSYHIGGFSGTNNVVTQKEFSLESSPLTVKENTHPEIVVKANPARLFHTVGSMTSLSATIHMPGATTTQMGKDFFDAAVLE
ncbi:MAG: hypothetical protein GC181_13990 [Bacteroidetes bacterium]|nr:hypothetical protein [Bacteroidota bacterium]